MTLIRIVLLSNGCAVITLFRIYLLITSWVSFRSCQTKTAVMTLFWSKLFYKGTVMTLFRHNSQPKCATITFFLHMPLFRHQRALRILPKGNVLISMLHVYVPTFLNRIHVLLQIQKRTNQSIKSTR